MRALSPRKLLKRFRQQKTVAKVALLGCAITVMVTLATWLGLLDEPERQLTDTRVKWCQIGRPEPSKEILHLDIDDTANEVIGRWPWPRSTIGQILEVLNEAGPRAVALDVLLVDPESESGPRPGDARVAKALAEGNYVLDYTLVESGDSGPQYARVRRALAANPLADAHTIAEQLGVSQIDVQPLLQAARASVVEEKVARLFAEGKGLADAATLRTKIFGPEATATSAAGEAIAAALRAQEAKLAILKFSAPLPRTASGLFAAPLGDVPLPEFTAASKSAGFVTYLPTGRGVVRSMPVVMVLGDRLVPSLGVALACAVEGVPLSALKLTSMGLVIPLKTGEVTVPLRREYYDSVGRAVSGVMDLTWPSTNRWETLYDLTGKTTAQHCSMALIGDILSMRRRLDENKASLIKDLEINLPTGSSVQSVLAEADRKLDQDRSFARDTLKQVEDTPADKRTADDLTAATQAKGFFVADGLAKTMHGILDRHAIRMIELKKLVHNKAVLIGWTATGKNDMVPTSLHSKCPGVMVHGTVFNAIMTGNFVRVAPLWVTLLCVLGIGGLTTLAVSEFSPWAGLVRAVALMFAYSVLNGVLLFGLMSRVVGIAGPLAVVPVVWGGCTVLRFFFERNDRRRIEQRFSTRVDPQLVQYVMENPDRIWFDGEERVMTVVFTDLAGFTTISEKLGPATVPLLNEYFQLMVPIIRKHRGYVNKFLGDGMMFFFNGVYANPNHTRDAIEAVLEMQRTLVKFNESLAQRDLPKVTMRVGITTGSMVVGDAGSDGASDYTVLGDNVNLAARLESANKATGTLVLVNDLAAEVIARDYLLRPVGSLQVVGKSQGVMTFEAIGPVAEATDQSRRTVKLSADIVEAFRRADLAGCEAAITVMEADGGPTKFTKLYHRAVATRRAAVESAGDLAKFTGTIELSEK